MKLSQKTVYPSLLFLTSLLLFLTNYKAGTYLIGWDNILPEFNIGLELQRNLSGVWQNYRGLGILDGQSHIANLIHTLFIFFASLFLPQNMLRYFANIFLHFLGGLGLYFLGKKYTGKPFISFLGALFYLFNIGTIQQFFAPFEGFSFQFAALPWLFKTGIDYLEKKDKKTLFFFLAASILSSPQGFVPTTFVTTSLSLFSLLFIDIAKNKSIRSCSILMTLFLAANSFWLLPYAYSIPKNAPMILNSHINQFSSEEMYLYNKAHGDIYNTLLLKGFMIDSIEYDIPKQSNVYFMEVWRNYTSTLPYKTLSVVFLGIILLGATSIIKNRKNQQYYSLYIFVISFIMLANNTFPLEQFNTALRTNFPLFAESFRFPFTKFISLGAFAYSLLFLEGMTTITKYDNRLRKYILASVFFGMVFIAYPAFLGNFFSPLLKVSMPKDYPQLFSYFDSIDENKRIALLPTHTFWPWHYRSWGQRGSGFLWFGLKQPIMERAFDPWSKYNEQFFNEFSYAVSLKDQELLNNVLAKYDISYLLIDQYIQDILFRPTIEYDQLEKFLDADPFLSKEKKFGKILVYKTKSPPAEVYSLHAENTPKVSSTFSFKREDSLVGENYVSSQKPNISYLFSSLSSENNQDNLDFRLEDTPTNITLTPKTPIAQGKNLRLEIPSLFENEFLIPVLIRMEEEKILLTPILGTLTVNNQQFVIQEDPLELEVENIVNPTTLVFESVHQEISLEDKNAYAYLVNNNINFIRLKDKNNNEEVLTLDTSTIKRHAVSFALPSPVKNIQISLEKIKGNLSFADVISKKSYTIEKNKTAIRPYASKDSYARITQNGGKLEFEAKSDSQELIVLKDTLFHQASYVLLAKTQYISGIPISFYFDNHPKIGADLEIRFPKKAPYAVIIIPKTEQYSSQGYAFHFTIKSIGKEKAKTTIGSIQLYPFPQKTLADIRIVDAYFTQNPDVKSIKNPIPFRKTSYFSYTLPSCCPYSYVALSQAFDSGWKGYEVKNSPFKMVHSVLTTFPFLFGKETKEHVLVNNWKNGWLIPSTTYNPQPTTYVIIYLPQYLEYLGFSLFITTLLFVWVKKPPKS